jgi:5-methyltetrahydrofolate--homocysteine methyltransferase
MNNIEALNQAVIQGDIQGAVARTQAALDDGSDILQIIDDALIAAMDHVGEQYAKGLLFVPQMLRAAKAMQECMQLIKPLLGEDQITSQGSVVIGTVQKDRHDIGKNLVIMMMEGAGFTVTDLGVDVAAEQFVDKAQEIKPDIVAMSALLSTTRPGMRETIEALQKAGIRDYVKVLIGGAPVTADYAAEIKADAYAPDAGSAVIEAKKLLGIA